MPPMVPVVHRVLRAPHCVPVWRGQMHKFGRGYSVYVYGSARRQSATISWPQLAP